MEMQLEFNEQYEKQLLNRERVEDPLEAKDNYIMNMDVDETIQYLDNVIEYNRLKMKEYNELKSKYEGDDQKAHLMKEKPIVE
jgi:hypothetical protein